MDEIKRDEARQRIIGMAKGLTALFGPVETAMLLLGPAITLLRTCLGDDRAQEVFRDIVREIETTAEVAN